MSVITYIVILFVSLTDEATIKARCYVFEMSLALHCLLVGAIAQSVERATPGEEVPASIPAVTALSLLVGSVLV